MSVQTAIPASRQYRLPAFTDSSRLRLLLGTLLYLAQGFPQGIVYYAIPTWFAATGQSVEIVGMAAAAASLPWTFKFLFGLLVDRYTWLPMGRRRPWLISAQLAIIIALSGFAILSPNVEATTLIIGFSLLVSTLTAIQDVALDALAADLTPDGEKGRLNGFMFAAKLVGISGGIGIMGYMLQYYGMREAMLSMLVCFTFPAAAAILIRERPGEKLLPWSAGKLSAQAEAVTLERWSEVFRTVFANIFNRTSLTVIAVVAIYGLHQAIFENSVALFAIQRLDWDQAFFSSFQSIGNLIGAAFCLLIGGWIIDKCGPARISIISGLFTASLLVTIGLAEEFFTSDAAFITWYAVIFAPTLLFYLSNLVLAMRVAESRVAATALAVIFGTSALGLTLGGLLLGPLQRLGGFGAMFTFAAVSIAISGAVGLALGANVGGKSVSGTDAQVT